MASCGENPYTPELTKTFEANGFYIKTTDDFVLQKTNEGINLTSEGDDIVSFDDTRFYGQYDMGNYYYDFENTTLEQYSSDIAKIENIELSSPVKNIRIIERLDKYFYEHIDMNMYVANINSGYYYKILCIGKGSNAFVYFSITTTIQDGYYYDNIEKLSSIIGSTVFSTPTKNNSYDESVTKYISTKLINTDALSYWNFVIGTPHDYVALTNSSHKYLNYLEKWNTSDSDWYSTIKCTNLAAFMGNAILDDYGVKHLIQFSTNNYAGFYTKKVENEKSATYKIYYAGSNNKLNINHFIITITYSDELNSLGFENYFEEQMIYWMKNVQILN